MSKTEDFGAIIHKARRRRGNVVVLAAGSEYTRSELEENGALVDNWFCGDDIPLPDDGGLWLLHGSVEWSDDVTEYDGADVFARFDIEARRLTADELERLAVGDLEGQ